MSIILDTHPAQISAQQLNGATAGESMKDWLNNLVAALGVPIANFTNLVPTQYNGNLGSYKTTNLFTFTTVPVAGQTLRIRAQSSSVRVNTLSLSTDSVQLNVNATVGGTVYAQTFQLEPATASADTPLVYDYTCTLSSFNAAAPNNMNGIHYGCAIALGNVEKAVTGSVFPGYNSGNWGTIKYDVNLAIKGLSPTRFIVETLNIDLINR